MRVLYRRLFNLGNYENETFEVDDLVADGESPEDTARRLRLIVSGMAENAARERDEERQRIAEANRQRREQEREALRRDRAREAADQLDNIF